MNFIIHKRDNFKLKIVRGRTTNEIIPRTGTVHTPKVRFGNTPEFVAKSAPTDPAKA